MLEQILKFADEHKNAIEAASNVLGTTAIVGVVGWVGWSWVKNARNGEAYADLVAQYGEVSDAFEAGVVEGERITLEAIASDEAVAKTHLKAVEAEKDVAAKLVPKKGEDKD